MGCTPEAVFCPSSPNKPTRGMETQQCCLACACVHGWLMSWRDAALKQPADQLLSACPNPKTCISAPGTALASGGVSLVRLPTAHEIFREVLRVHYSPKDACLFLKADVHSVCFCCLDSQTKHKCL